MRTYRAVLLVALALGGCGTGGSSGGGSGTGAPARGTARSSLEWLSSDVGAVGQEGSDARMGASVTVHASGSDIWGNADAFRFVSTRLSGDGELVARVASLEPTDAWAKAGVMIRESLDPGSAFAMSVVTPAHGATLQHRSAAGGSAGMAPTSPGTAPLWLRIRRTGHLFEGAVSADGATFTSLGEVTIAMGADVLIGLCVTAHANATQARAEFDSLRLGGSAVELAPPPALRPVAFDKVALADPFWAPRITTNRTVSLRMKHQNFVDNHNLDNFPKAAGLMSGNHDGFLWADSDVHKTLEGMAYAIRLQPDGELEGKLEAAVANIAAAQVSSGPLKGYLNTFFQLGNAGRGSGGSTLLVQPWEDLRVYHEDYVAGHLIEAALAHHRATGRRTFLDVARKYADHMATTFGEHARSGIPGHQEAELALMRLAAVPGAGKASDLELASFYVNERGRYSGGRTIYGEYCQDLEPIRVATEPVGHCVRGPYMWAGATDVAAAAGDAELLAAVERLWTAVVERKMYATGSIGHGLYNEGFGPDWDLSNEWAYNETCASCAMMFWSQRLANLQADGKYMDVLERILYNGFASGRSLNGDRLYYNNYMVRSGDRGRMGIDCCATNIVRTVPSIPGWQYAVRDGQGVWVHLYMAGQASVSFDGVTLGLKQESNYPWDGAVKLTLSLPEPRTFSLNLRIPAWAAGATAAVNGAGTALSPVKGYAPITRAWQNGDVVDLQLPLAVRRIHSDARVAANQGRVAIARGPLVYCLESEDNSAPVHRIVVPAGAALSTQHDGGFLGGLTRITGTGLHADTAAPVAFTMIPYGLWDNRGHDSSMCVMVPETAAAASGGPDRGRLADAVASWSFKNASDSGAALNDGLWPRNSADGTIPRFTWWSHQGTSEWVAYEFPAPLQVWRSDIFWYADAEQGGGCDFPQAFQHEYWDGSAWRPLVLAHDYGGNDLYSGGHFTIVRFQPVTTTRVRLNVQLKPGKSGGVLEWRLPE
jgi:uncharacterized protein